MTFGFKLLTGACAGFLIGIGLCGFEHLVLFGGRPGFGRVSSAGFFLCAASLLLVIAAFFLIVATAIAGHFKR